MVFVTMLQEPLPLQLALQELALLIPLPQPMLLAQHGGVDVFGLELQDVKMLQLAQDLMEQSIHAQHSQEAMAHAQEQDQPQPLVSLILQYVIKHLLHLPLMLNAKHGMQLALQMDLDVCLKLHAI